MKQGSRNTLYDISAVEIEDIEDRDYDEEYFSQRKNTESYPRGNLSSYDSQVQ